MKDKIIGFILGILVTSTVGVGAAAIVASTDVSLSSTKTSNTNVKSALDDLYDKTNVGTATSADIKDGKTALVNGKLVTGTLKSGGIQFVDDSTFEQLTLPYTATEDCIVAVTLSSATASGRKVAGGTGSDTASYSNGNSNVSTISHTGTVLLSYTGSINQKSSQYMGEDRYFDGSMAYGSTYYISLKSGQSITSATNLINALKLEIDTPKIEKITLPYTATENKVVAVTMSSSIGKGYKSAGGTGSDTKNYTSGNSDVTTVNYDGVLLKSFSGSVDFSTSQYMGQDRYYRGCTAYGGITFIFLREGKTLTSANNFIGAATLN